MKLVIDGSLQNAGRPRHKFSKMRLQSDQRCIPKHSMIRVEQVADKRYAIFRAWLLPPAQSPSTVVNDGLGLAAHLIAGEVGNICRLKRLAKHLQRIQKTIQLFLLNIG